MRRVSLLTNERRFVLIYEILWPSTPPKSFLCFFYPLSRPSVIYSSQIRVHGGVLRSSRLIQGAASLIHRFEFSHVDIL